MRKEENRDLEDKKTAYLYYLEKNQQAVAKRLRVSQATISQRLKRAKHKKWIDVKTTATIECNFSREELRKLEHSVSDEFKSLEPKLRAVEEPKRSGSATARLRNVQVFGSGGSQERHRETFHEFGRNAAPYLERLIKQMSCAGVSWGRTISGLVGTFRENPPTPNRSATLFFPTCAEPLGTPDIGDSASQLAADLHQLFHTPGAEKPPSLSAVPNCIPGPSTRPKPFTSAEARGIRRFFRERVDGYKRIFSGKQSLMSKMDSVITSVGNSEQSDDAWLRERINAVGLNHTEFSRITIGDIGGVYLPRHNLTESKKRKFKEITESWTGIRLEDFQQCARRLGKVGVVVVAIGKGKAEVIYECVRHGLINELIIDYELADDLLSRLS